MNNLDKPAPTPYNDPTTGKALLMRDKAASSRLVRKEKQRMMRQTVLLGVGSIALLLAFLFVILPIFFQVFVKFFAGGAPTEENTLPLQPPTLSAPVSATNSATLKLSGFAQADQQVVVVLNGQKGEPVEVADDGQFSTDIDLVEGENSLAAYAVAAEGKESNIGKTYTTLLDTKTPILTIDSPEDGKTIESRQNQLLTISGKTDEGAQVFVNDRTIFPQADGTFSSQYQLQEGENKLEFRAVDEAGNETKAPRTVTFKL